MSESGFETSSLDEVEAVLDGMENPTSEDVWHATLPYSDRAVAAVAAARAGSGGSSPSVTDGETTLAAAAISFPMGTVSDLGSDTAGIGNIFSVQMIDIAHDTPGLNNPSDNPHDIGALLATVPAGSLFRAVVALTEAWDQPGSGDVRFADPTGANATSYAICFPDLVSGSLSDGVFGLSETTPRPFGLNGSSQETNLTVPRFGYAVQECGIYAAFYPDGSDPTAGAAKVFLLVASPAA